MAKVPWSMHFETHSVVVNLRVAWAVVVSLRVLRPTFLGGDFLMTSEITNSPLEPETTPICSGWKWWLPTISYTIQDLELSNWINHLYTFSGSRPYLGCVSGPFLISNRWWDQVGLPIDGMQVDYLDTPGVGDMDVTPMKVLTLIEQELLGTRVVGYFQFICLFPNFFPEKVYLSGVFSEKRKKKQWGKAAGRTGHVLGAQRVSVYLWCPKQVYLQKSLLGKEVGDGRGSFSVGFAMSFFMCLFMCSGMYRFVFLFVSLHVCCWSFCSCRFVTPKKTLSHAVSFFLSLFGVYACIILYIFLA